MSNQTPSFTKEQIAFLSSQGFFFDSPKIETTFENFLSSKGFPVFPLISENSKVEASLDLLHGSNWNQTKVFQNNIDGLINRAKGNEDKKPSKLSQQWIEALESYDVLSQEKQVCGTCEKAVISECWGFKDKNGKQGTCYCNGHQYIHANPHKFFQAFIRAEYFRLHSLDAWKSVTKYVQENDFSFPKKLFRLFGQGDLEANQVENFIKALSPVKHLVSGFVRRSTVWEELLHNGFFCIAHSIDVTILNRPHHIKHLVKIKEKFGSKARIVFAPLNAKTLTKEQLKKIVELSFLFDVVIEKHSGGVINKETLAFTNEVKLAYYCPTTRDKMKGNNSKDKNPEPRQCFNGCVACHIGKGAKQAFAV